jgi:hypothetical protein
MAKSKKRQRLEEAGLLDPNKKLTKDQSKAIDTLTPDEVEAVISAKNKLKDRFHITAQGFGNPPTHSNR